MPINRPDFQDILKNQEKHDELMGIVSRKVSDGIEYKSGWAQLHDRYWQHFLAKPDSPTKTWPWDNAPVSDDTEILTDRGWVNITEVEVGKDEVFSQDPDTGETAFKPVLAKPFRHYDMMIHLHNKSVDQLVSPDHNCWVKQIGTGKSLFLTAAELLKRDGGNLHIPLTSKPFKGDDPPNLFGLDPHITCQFIGLYIAEGYRYSSGLGIAQSESAYPEYRKHVRGILKGLGFKFSEYPDKFWISKTSIPFGLLSTLQNLGLAHEKHIPPEFLKLSSEYLECLLAGLVLGDGHYRVRPGRSQPVAGYFTISWLLADQIQELCQKIGLRATIRSREARMGGRIYGRPIVGTRTGYDIGINFKKNSKVSRLKKELVPYNRLAYCVTTPWHTIYIRRNGKASFTGNCNYVPPMITVAVQTLNSMFYDAMYSGRPRVIGTDDTDQAQAELLDRYYFEHFWKKVIAIEHLGDAWNFETLIDGTSAVYPRWSRELVGIRRDDIDVTPKTRTDTIMALNREIKTKVITGFEENITEEFRAVRIERPFVEIQDMERLFIAPGTKRSLDMAGSLNWPHCPWYFIDKYFSIPALRNMANNGFMGMDTEDEIKALVGEVELTERERAQADHEDIAQKGGRGALFHIFFDRLVLPGKITMPDGETKTQDFMDPGGIPEEVILWYSPKGKRISKIAPLSRFHPDNKRPHIDNHYSRMGNFFFSQGIPALLEQTAKLYGSSVRQGIDNGTIQNKPWAFYEPAETGLIPNVQQIAPGSLIPVKNARSVQIPHFQAGNHEFWKSIEQVALQWQERLTNVTDFVIGRAPSIPNAPRTARGQSMMLQQANIAFSHQVALMAIPPRELFRKVHRLHQRHAPENTEFEFFNEAKGVLTRESIPREAFRADVDFTFELNPNRQLEKQEAQQDLAMVMNMPFLAQNPESARNALSEVYAARGKLDFFNNKIWPQERIEVQSGAPAAPGLAEAAGNIAPFPQQDLETEVEEDVVDDAGVGL